MNTSWCLLNSRDVSECIIARDVRLLALAKHVIGFITQVLQWMIITNDCSVILVFVYTHKAIVNE